MSNLLYKLYWKVIVISLLVILARQMAAQEYPVPQFGEPVIVIQIPDQILEPKLSPQGNYVVGVSWRREQIDGFWMDILTGLHVWDLRSLDTSEGLDANQLACQP